MAYLITLLAGIRENFGGSFDFPTNGGKTPEGRKREQERADGEQSTLIITVTHYEFVFYLRVLDRSEIGPESSLRPRRPSNSPRWKVFEGGLSCKEALRATVASDVPSAADVDRTVLAHRVPLRESGDHKLE